MKFIYYTTSQEKLSNVIQIFKKTPKFTLIKILYLKQRNVIEAVVILIGCLQSVWARRALLPVYFCSICWVACRITACQNLLHPTRSLPSSCCYQSRLCALLLQCSPALTRLLSQPLWRTLSFHLISRHRCRVSFILEIHKKIF